MNFLSLRVDFVKKYIPFHFLIGALLGILIEFYLHVWSFGVYYLLIALFLKLLVIFIVFYKKLYQVVSFSFLLLFIWIGSFVTYMSNDSNYKDYFSNLSSEKAVLEITKILKSNNYCSRYEAEVVRCGGVSSRGAIILELDRDTIYKVGQIIFSDFKPKLVKKRRKPYGFDYADYLKKHGINYQLKVSCENYRVLPLRKKSAYSFVSDIRLSIQNSLKELPFTQNTYAIINAMLLGDRGFMNTSLRNDFVNAGIVHVLAISGLHVGILMYFLSTLFSPLRRFKYGAILSNIIVLFTLWAFAFLSGLSSSVVRAVTMFSFMLIAKLLNRKTPIEYSLVSSMLLIVLVKPLSIFDIGFQLSYLAVLGIIWIRPFLLKLYNPKFLFTKYLWNLATVSISAQLAVLPLSLYYFSQFPCLFLISNLVVIPLLGPFIVYGVIVIIFSCIGYKLPVFYIVYDFITTKLTQFVSLISSYEEFVLKDVSLSFFTVLMLYFLLLVLVKVISGFKTKYVLVFLFGVLIIQVYETYKYFERSSQSELIIYHKTKFTRISVLQGANLKVFSDTIFDLDKYCSTKGVKIDKYHKVPDLIDFRANVFVIIDSIGVYPNTKLKSPIVVLRNSPKINLERMLSELNPIEVVVDGSNYKSYVDLVRKVCEKKNIHFHSTYENGYKVFK